VAAHPIPFMDLSAGHAPLADELDAVWRSTVATSAFIGGNEVEAFEQAFAAYCERRHCVSTANGTDSIELTLAALAGLLYACSSTSVGVDRDPDYDFTGKQTYAWKEGVPAENELHQKRIVAGVDGELTRRGLRRVEGEAPDLWVLTEVAGHREVR